MKLAKLFWLLVLLSIAPLCLADHRPNFVIIMADDLGYGDLGCYGSKRIRTPHLDRLAAEGMKFTDFHSSGAVCSPTRAGLMTGRYQQRAGIPSVIFADSNRTTHPHGIQPQEVTFAEVLTAADYKGQLWEGGHRVPCIAWWPGRIAAGGVSHELAITLDLFPTILSAAGIDPPPGRKLDGVDLLPAMVDRIPLGNRTLFWGHDKTRAMRDGSWKLVTGGRGQKLPVLFNLADDVAEQTDISEQKPERVNSMMAMIKRWEKTVEDGASHQPDSPPIGKQ